MDHTATVHKRKYIG